MLNINLTKIADISGIFSSFALPRSSALSKIGRIIWFARLDNGGSAIYAGLGQKILTIADTSQNFPEFGCSMKNNSSTVAFQARTN